MGNGTLLVTFDGTGEIDQIFGPYIDALGGRVGAFRTSVLIAQPHGQAPERLRIVPEEFQIRLTLGTGSQVLQAEYHHRHRPIKLRRTLALHPTEPVIIDVWKTLEEKVGLLHESVPWMGHSTAAHCSMYHPAFNGLVHHRGRRWLGVIARGDTQWVRVGHLSNEDRYKLWDGERVYVPVGAHDIGAYPTGPVKLGWDQVVQGCTTWGALAVGPGDEMQFYYIIAESERHLGQLIQMQEHIPQRRFFQMVESRVQNRHEPAQPWLNRVRHPQVRSLCERSLDILHSLQDAKTGALMAGAEVDPHSRLSGGYGYSWPRDGAYFATALGAFGYHQRVEQYCKFLAETQDPSGAWWQRYLATGHAGPSWGRIQIDEPASVIGIAYLHFSRTKDFIWLQNYWPTIQRGLRFLEEFHGPEHPLGQPSHDLWEERMGIHAYSLAAVANAFNVGAHLAGELGETQLQSRYNERGKRFTHLIQENFAPDEGPIRRSFVVNSWDYHRGGGYWDEVADVSMLGLIRPFGVLDRKGQAAHRIIEMVRSRLWSKSVGGLVRYEGDHYRGGNPWVLTTLWLAGVDLTLGNRQEARELFQWSTSKATELGMLPEQVHKESGRPFWVIPLAWSHAMYLIFVRDVLDRKAEGQIWDTIM